MLDFCLASDCVSPGLLSRKGERAMSEESTATIEYSDVTKKLGDTIVELSLKEAKELSDYLKKEHGIEAAAGGGVMMVGPTDGGGGAAAAEEQTEFDVVLESFGDKKIGVIKEVRH